MPGLLPSTSRFSAAGAALAAVLALAGCSNDPYPPGETARPVMFLYMQGDLRTLDPSVSYTVDEAAVTDLIYPSFYKYHALKTHPYRLALNLGAEEPKREPYLFTDTSGGKAVQKKGEAWTFRFKRGLHFQDDPCFPGGKGREITAADIAFAFRRMADPNLNPPCPVFPFVQDKIIGIDDYAKELRKKKDAHQPIDLAQGVSGLELDPKDPYALRILLNQPYPQLRYLMAMHFTTPLAHEAIEKYDDDLRAPHAVGCGQYLLEDYQIKRQIVLAKNPDRPPEFYPSEGEPGDAEAGLLKDAGKRLPLTDKIVFSFQREGITGWNLFTQGYLDRWSVRPENLRQVMTQQGALTPEMRRKGIRLQKAAIPSVMYFIFNMEDPVIGGYTPQKRKLRQAISTAIDSQAFIDLFRLGVGTPAQGLIPPGLFGYEESYKNPYRRYGVERAKQLLAEAGYPDGQDPKTGAPLTLSFDYAEAGAAQRQFVGLLEKQMNAVGIKLEARAWRDVVWQDRVDKGQFQFINYGWIADYPDPENFVFLAYGPNKRPGVNHAAYENPEYDRLFEQMRSMDNTPERMALIRRLREIVQDDCPLVFLYHDEVLLLNHQWISNTKPHGVANDTAKYRRVDGPLRARLQKEWNQPNYWPSAALAVFILLGSIPAAQVVRQRRRRKVRRHTGG